MRIYFIRHAESEGNATETHQSLETPLSENGYAQVKLLTDRLATVTLDSIYTSDYLRARSTAEAIAERTQKPLILEPLLREMKKPTEIEQKSVHDPEVVRIKHLLIAHQDDPAWHYSDEENVSDLHKRATTMLQKLISSPDEHIAVVSHGSFTRMMIATMLFGEKLTPQIYQPFRHFFVLKNTGISVCTYEENRWQLLTWDDYRHVLQTPHQFA